MNREIYLDFAATSAVRPPEVIDAVTHYLRDIGATPGRSGHRRALEAGRIVFRCRRALAELFNIPGDPGRISFQYNATHALNVALQGLLRPGDRLVRTAYDHNAVRRPAAALTGSGVDVQVVSGHPDGSLDLNEVAERIGAGPTAARVVALPLASNVLGQRLPVSQVAEIAHAAGALVLVDAAQGAGHLHLDVEKEGIDLLAFTGHKGLLGPQGVGGLWVREGIDVQPLLSGGTGGDSVPYEMPLQYPDHLEAGTLNGPAIAGLLAGVNWLQRRGVAALASREQRLKRRLRSGLESLPGIQMRSPAGEDGVGIVTFTADGMDAAEFAARLDRDHAVQARAGLHCAPDAHAVIGTLKTGAVRFSLGWASTEEEVDAAVAAVASIQDSAINA